MSDIVKLEIKISGSDSFKEVEVSAKDLAEAIDKVKKHTHDLNEKLLNVNQITQAIDQVTSAVQSLHSVMCDLTDAYGVQAAAEARLEQMMRNTMDATDDEIQSIKNLAAEQQKLGVIGDEVILSGAQELATYMTKKESLEALIPVMNDMIAQQYDYNATTQSAVSVAQMMGKVFAGETGALKRLGYTFDEAQEQILKYGTEEERVATLTEVIGQIVDGTNAKLAATPYGKIVQTRMAFGDLKEEIGAMVAPAMGAVEKLANITIALSGIAKGAVYVKKCTDALTAFAQSSNMAATRTAVLGVHSRVTATAQNMLAAAGIRAAAGTTALRVATAALYATMTMGLSLAIQGIITLITRLTSKTREAADGMDTLKEANEAFSNTASTASGEIEAETAKLKQLMDSHADTTEAVNHLNEKYGEAFGQFKTAQEWYDTLIAKSKDYCDQLGYEAMARVYAEKKAEAQFKYEKLQKEAEANPNKYKQVKSYNWATEVTTYSTYETRKYQKQKEAAAAAKAEVDEYDAAMQGAFKNAAEAGKKLTTTIESGSNAVSWQTMSYAQLGDAIKDQKKKVGELAEATSDAAQRETATLAAMQKRHHDLGVQLGLETESTKGTTKETVVLGNELTNLKEINAKIAELEKQRLEASKDEIKAIDTQIDRVKRLKAEFEGTPMESNLIPQLKPITPGKQTYPDTLPAREKSPIAFDSSKEFSDYLTKLNEKLDLAPRKNRAAIQEEIAFVQRLKDEFEGVNQTVAQMSASEAFTKGWGGLKGIGNSFRDIHDALTKTDNAWDALIQTVDGFISMIQSFQQIIEIIDTITAATKALGIAKTAETAITKADANAKMEDAAAGAASSVAAIPMVGAFMVGAAVGAVIASLSSLPKFANGGLVYGPTLGLMGEYGGASSNPEVIAPLSRLRALLGTDGPGQPSEVKFRIEGRELVGIMNKQTNIYRRAR